MDRILVIVFDGMLKTYEGDEALVKLDSEGSISVHAEAVIEKYVNGTVGIKQMGKNFPIRTVSGTAVGSLIGLLGGPIGLGVGAVAGTFAGNMLDLHRAGVDADFLTEVSAKLTPGKWAIVTEVSEEWVTPVDTKMEALGGTVFRTTRENIELEHYARDVITLRADIAQLKEEQSKSRVVEKGMLQVKIDILSEKLSAKLLAAKQRLEEIEEEANAEVEALEKKAAKAKGEAKVVIEARIADIKEKSKKFSEDFEKLNEDAVN
jgi:uncharacterized membrane protein